MAITSSLSCVDYLSIKFGCQSLNSDKEIYNHLSQEWFYRPLIKEFSFNAKNDSWSNIFQDSEFATDQGKITSKRLRNFVNHKRQKQVKVSAKNGKNRGFCANFKIIEDTKNACEYAGFSDQVDNNKNCKIAENNEPSINLEFIENDCSFVDDDCLSESEQELMQIYRHSEEDLKENFEPLKLSRKRTSTECLDHTENENSAKRMRPSINITRMHESRIPCVEHKGNEERFVPICVGQDYL